MMKCLRRIRLGQPPAARPRGRERLLALALAAMLAGSLVGCGPGEDGAGPAGELKAWIDAPLDSSTLPLAPYGIVCHGAGGAQLIELKVNGRTEAEIPATDGEELVIARHTWTPPGPGRYRLEARARDAQGQWSEADSVTVVVEGTPTSTTVPETAAPTPSRTTTAPPSAGQTTGTTSTTTGDRPTDISGPQRSAELFFYQYCGTPNEVTLTVRATDGSGVDSVSIRYRLKRADGQQLTHWFERPLAAIGGDRYRITLRAEDDFELQFLGTESLLEYQFQAKNSRGDQTGSPTWEDIVLMGCSARTRTR